MSDLAPELLADFTKGELIDEIKRLTAELGQTQRLYAEVHDKFIGEMLVNHSLTREVERLNEQIQSERVAGHLLVEQLIDERDDLKRNYEEASRALDYFNEVAAEARR